jgi:uncharacterized protein YbjT (DUF2867 family)
MQKESKIILVAGATGKQGGAVIRHLQAKEWKVRALTRDKNTEAAQTLAKKGADVYQGNMNDLQSLEKAMDNVYGVFSVQDFWIVGVEEEIQQGKNMADVAKKMGIKHFVYSSAAGADRNSGVDHFDSKYVIEEYIKSSGLRWTILRPVGFMENYHIPQLKNRLLKGKLADPVMPSRKLQLISTDDIGGLAAAAFDKPEKYADQAFDIASDELTNPEIAEIFGRVIGSSIRFSRLPMLMVRLFMGKELYQMFRWYNKVGYDVDIPALQRKFPEVKLTRFEEWLTQDGWGKVSN